MTETKPGEAPTLLEYVVAEFLKRYPQEPAVADFISTLLSDLVKFGDAFLVENPPVGVSYTEGLSLRLADGLELSLGQSPGGPADADPGRQVILSPASLQRGMVVDNSSTDVFNPKK